MTESKERSEETDTFTIGGLHIDDFDWASKEYEEIGYVLVGFVMEADSYHWKAVYVKTEQLGKALRRSE